jgi:hypothetical protein
MKVILCISLFLIVGQASAQVNIGPISKTAYCVGDTLRVPYQAVSSFGSQNVFTLQLSDSSGSFTHFTNAAQSPQSSGAFSYQLNAIGQHFRVRVITSDPYTISADNGTDISVLAIPTPRLRAERTANSGRPSYFAYGLIGDEVVFRDVTTEPAGSIYLWKFDSNTVAVDSAGPIQKVVFTTEGRRNASLTVVNPIGCDGHITSSNFYIASCNPIIPKSAKVITGLNNDYGNDMTVWVKPGATFTVWGDNITIFAEPGSVLNINHGTRLVGYIKNGVSFGGNLNAASGVFMLTPGASFPVTEPGLDTLYCDNLTFDYSQVNSAGIVEEYQPQVAIHQAPDHLLATSANQPIELRLLNLLGNEVLSRRGVGELDIDLTPVPTGIYIAIAESGGQRVTKKIAVVN